MRPSDAHVADAKIPPWRSHDGTKQRCSQLAWAEPAATATTVTRRKNHPKNRGSKDYAERDPSVERSTRVGIAIPVSGARALAGAGRRCAQCHPRSRVISRKRCRRQRRHRKKGSNRSQSVQLFGHSYSSLYELDSKARKACPPPGRSISSEKPP